MRVETIGDATLYLGDSLEILPTLGKVDACITDPPYGVAGGVGGDAKDFGKAAYEGSFPDTPEYIADVCSKVIQWCIDNSEAVALTPGNRCLQLYPQARDIGAFWQPASTTHGPWGMVTLNPILYYGKDWRAGRGALPSGRQVTEKGEKNGHPCSKPLLAWTWLVDKVARPGSLVVDPFMGSGTTAVSCLKTGRKFIGIEREPKYFDIACKRIEQAVSQGQLFTPAAPKAVQEALL
jgi:site-specific DNA-methyltransferase (adenine-specific)/modification methylase